LKTRTPKKRLKRRIHGKEKEMSCEEEVVIDRESHEEEGFLKSCSLSTLLCYVCPRSSSDSQ